MAYDSHKAQMKIKWTEVYAIIEVNPIGGYKLKDKHGRCLKSNFLPKKSSAITRTWRYKSPMKNTISPSYLLN